MVVAAVFNQRKRKNC